MRRHVGLISGLGLLLALLPSARATGGGPEAALATAPPAAPLGSGITYQGFLKQNGVPANGLFNMQFQLFDAATGGTPLGAVSLPNVPVTNGQFTVGLDFGAGAFSGEARWLAITVGGTLLSPRQEVRAAPYALFAPTAGTATSATSATTATTFTGSLAGDVTGSQGTTVVAAVGGQTAANVASGVAAANGATASNTANTLVRRDAAGNFGAGTITANVVGNVTGTASGDWSRTGNSAGAGEFLGTTNAVALELRVNNAGALRLEPNAVSPNVVGGFSGNSVLQNVVGATIGGGGNSGMAPDGPNRVTDDYGTVGGGRNNQAGDNVGSPSDRPFATVGGGSNNTANGFGATVGGGSNNTANGFGATVGGGQFNTASGDTATVGGGIINMASGSSATVGGGQNNVASGIEATVGGGVSNTAGGNDATVPGGFDNDASGNFSFAAGRQARALGDGTFVWNDSNTVGAPFRSDLNLGSFGSVSTTNSFHVRATGGARFVTNTGNNTGLYVNPSGTAWNNSSHSSLKTDFAAVDVRAVLEGLVGLPLTTWRLRAGDPAVRHLGPMAEDFYAAFGLGDGDRAINTLDADGVAFAAIQGLYGLVQEEVATLAEALAERDAALAARDAALEALSEHLATLQADQAARAEQLAALAARLAVLEEAVAAGQAP